MNKIGFFESTPGNQCDTRLKCFLVLLFFFAFNCVYVVVGKHDVDMNITFFDMMLLIAIFAPEYLVKLAEMKFGQNQSTTSSTATATVATVTTEVKP